MHHSLHAFPCNLRRQEGLDFADTEAEMAPAAPATSLAQRTRRSFLATASGWRAYGRQEVVPAAVALALLYLTVMSFVRSHRSLPSTVPGLCIFMLYSVDAKAARLPNPHTTAWIDKYLSRLHVACMHLPGGKPLQRLSRHSCTLRIGRQAVGACYLVSLARFQSLNVHPQGLLMTAYLKWRGLSEMLLSLYRAGGALAGIASTLAFPAIQQRLGAQPVQAAIPFPPTLAPCWLPPLPCGSAWQLVSPGSASCFAI